MAQETLLILAGISFLGAVMSMIFCLKTANLVDKAKVMPRPHREEPPKPSKVVVPGKGIFSVAKDKHKPKWKSEEQIWAIEQDERKS